MKKKTIKNSTRVNHGNLVNTLRVLSFDVPTIGDNRPEPTNPYVIIIIISNNNFFFICHSRASVYIAPTSKKYCKKKKK